MIAYHFPPLSGSSGIQRTLRFVQHLPALGWEPLVLTAHTRAYENTSDDLLREVPPETKVHRAFALDTARHLQFRGRYLGWMAQPDRWVSWKLDGVREGMRMIERYKPQVIWSTHPIPTAHLIASQLSRRSGLPWVADFRDPMFQKNYPVDPATRRSYKSVEEEVFARAKCCVVTTPGAARLYRDRYPHMAERVALLENGYDEESFPERNPPRLAAVPVGRPLILLHSGIVYPFERDPRALFMALRRLLDAGRITASDVRIRFRASVHDQLLHALAGEHGVGALIELCPAIPYREALAEMMAADALLVLQAADCNDQIPAKIYEYLRAGRPILGLTEHEGDTAAALREAGLDAIARLSSADEIANLLPAFLDQVRAGQAALPSQEAVQRASRRGRSACLAQLLGEVSA
jgi:Glycosyl transferase 4-like domain